MQIEIPEEISKKLLEYQKTTSIKNTSDLVNYILEEYLKNNVSSEEKNEMNDSLKKRLKDLGYF